MDDIRIIHKTPAGEQPDAADFNDIFGEIEPAATGGDVPVTAEPEAVKVRVVPGFVEPMAALPKKKEEQKEHPEQAPPRKRRDEARAEGAVGSGWRRFRIGLPRLLAIGAAGGVALAILAILFFPYGSYRPGIERRMSNALQDTVRVGGVGVRFTPLPALVLTGVTVGDGYASAASVRLLPAFASLFGGDRRLREVHVEGMRLDQAGIGRAARWLPAGALRELSVGRVILDDVTVEFGQASIGGLSGEGRADPENGLVRWSLRNREGTLRLEAAPGQGEAAALAVSAASWRMPFKPALLFDALTVEGELSAGKFRFGKLDGRLYDGLIEGAGVLAWGDGARFEGDLAFKRLAADRLMAALSAEPDIEGAASGRLRLDAQASTLAGLAAAVRMTGHFDIAQGVLRRIDLAEAIRARAPIRGGATRFEQFSGGLAADERGVRLTELQLASGLMRANGQVAVGRDGEIAGEGVVEMKGSLGGRHAAFEIGGKADDPELRPGR